MTHEWLVVTLESVREEEVCDLHIVTEAHQL